MSSVIIKADQSVERVSHCIFCNDPARQIAPLTLRYFAKDSFVANLLSPLIRFRHLIYALLVISAVVSISLLIILFVKLNRRFKGSDYEYLVPIMSYLLPYFVFKLFERYLSKAVQAIPWKVLRTGKVEIQSPVCDRHFHSTAIHSKYFDPSQSLKLKAKHLIFILCFLLGLYALSAYLKPSDWMEQIAFVVAVVMALFAITIAWAVVSYQVRRSQRYLTGFANDLRDEFEILNCSESFATEASIAKVLLEINQPIVTSSVLS